MDGQPFRYVAGSFHYFRALPSTWQRKLRAMRAGGLNAVDVYIQWSLHNPKDGVYNWEGIADIKEFIRLATEEDLYIILRPGPYICAEIDNGGLPYWLETKYPGIQVRSDDPDYLKEVEIWYEKFFNEIAGQMYGEGGKIIMVQVENEYGAYKTCNTFYKNWLRDLTRRFTADNALLFTTDRPIDNELSCGLINGVFATVDFGIANYTEVESHFRKLREVQPRGPLVNSEFYTGWLTHWQEPNARRSAYELAVTLRTMLDEPYNANVNFYMYFGGTNFGFWAGANDWGIGAYMADITSYDYDAPLDEAGDPASKYYILRDVIEEFLTLPTITTPSRTPKIIYPSFNVQITENIFSSDARITLGSTPINAGGKLWTFEEMDQNSGFVLYEADLPKFTRDPAQLYINKLRDRAQIFIDGKHVGVLSRENNIYSMPIPAGYGKRIQIFVENQGRINFQENFDLKGILGNVTVQTFNDPYYEEVTDWTVTGYPFDDYARIQEFITTSGFRTNPSFKNGWLKDGPALLHGELIINGTPGDTWWNTRGFGKGVLFVNGFNLGRYWPLAGPQMTMYIPGDLLVTGVNTFTILEQQKVPDDFLIHFTDEPDFNEDNVA